MIDLDRTVLPDPDSPTTPRVCPDRELERHAVYGSHESPVGDERRAQVVDLQEGPFELLDRGEGELPRRGIRSHVSLADVEPGTETVAYVADRDQQEEQVEAGEQGDPDVAVVLQVGNALGDDVPDTRVRLGYRKSEEREGALDDRHRWRPR